MKRFVVAALAAAGCGGDGGSAVDATGPDADTCDPSCVELRWWVTTTSGCEAPCTIDPSLDECAESDCEMIEARFYDGTEVASLAAVLHSATGGSIYVAAAPSAEPYSVGTDCRISTETGMPQSFACDAQMLTFQTAIFTSPSAGLQGALEAALAVGTTGRYPYP